MERKGWGRTGQPGDRERSDGDMESGSIRGGWGDMETGNVLAQQIGEPSSLCSMLQEGIQAGFENNLLVHLLLDSTCFCV